MTERQEEVFETEPGGLLVPGDIDPDDRLEEWAADPLGGETVEEKLDRIEALLRAHGNRGLQRRLEKVEENFERLLRTVPATADFEGLKAGQEIGFVAVRTGLADIRSDLLGISRAVGVAATRQDVEDVLRVQRDEFGYLKEGLAWARGAATAGAPAPRPDPAPRSRAGVAMLCLLWVLTVVAAFGAGAVAFGGLRVDVAWEPGSARQAAAGQPSQRGDSVDERQRKQAAAERVSRSLESKRELERLEDARAAGVELMPVLSGHAERPKERMPPRRDPPVVEPGTP